MRTLQPRYTEERFNKFFNPNICHVCKEKYNRNFVNCIKCYMISYCTEEHRLENEIHHTQFCAVLQELFISHPRFWYCEYFNQEEWIKSRKEFVHLIQAKLFRDLEPYEVQMIMFAKSCFKCHQQSYLDTCTKCYSFNYCDNHAETLIIHQISDCVKLEICFDIDMKLYEIISLPKLKFTKFPNKYQSCLNMLEFISNFVLIPLLSVERYVSSGIKYYYTDYVSAPLTTYYQMYDAKLSVPGRIRKNCYIIHIIAANCIDNEYLPAWELFLHLLHRIKDLKVILIGSGLQNERGDVEICSRCTRRKQQLNYECHCMLYHNYVNSDLYIQPDVIVGFQVDLSDWKELSESILKVRDQNCPLLLTAESQVKAEHNTNKLQEVLGSPLNIIHQKQNEFKSIRVYTNFESDLSCRNEWVTIYKNLHVHRAFVKTINIFLDN